VVVALLLSFFFQFGQDEFLLPGPENLEFFKFQDKIILFFLIFLSKPHYRLHCDLFGLLLVSFNGGDYLADCCLL
jgi:hypothetical protein